MNTRKACKGINHNYNPISLKGECAECGGLEPNVGNMNTKHTPGPLSFDGMGVNGGDEYASRIATFTKQFPDMQDARHYGPLFAASPEMYQLIRDIWDSPMFNHGKPSEFASRIVDILNKIKGGK